MLPRHLRDLHAAHGAALAPIWDPASGLTVQVRVPSGTSVHPARQRCARCRKGFGAAPVVLGLFCSYRCARLPEPTSDVDAAPRVCKRATRADEPGDWAFKQRFTSEAEAQRYRRDGQQVYRCHHCFFLHIGNPSSGPINPNALPVPSDRAATMLDHCAQALLATRRQDRTEAAWAAAKRDARAVLDAARAWEPAGR